jgi:dTDP-4-dehydrorhamnose reductase
MKGLILVLGSDGMVGSRFVELSPRQNFLHLPREVEFDITDPAQVKDVFRDYKFSCVVNFAAFTNVSEAEDQRGDKNGLCWQVNYKGVCNLVDAIGPNTHFIQISTDMVFSGSAKDPGPYSEDHETEVNENNVTWYGWSKSQAEQYIKQKLNERATIVRITYPVRAHFPQKPDFLRKALKLYDEGKLFPLLTDQQITFSFVDEIAHSLNRIIAQKKSGTFHISCPDTTTPHEIISYMLYKLRGVEKSELETTDLHELIKKTNASVVRYPKYGGLKSQFSAKALSMDFMSGKKIVDKLIEQGMG